MGNQQNKTQNNSKQRQFTKKQQDDDLPPPIPAKYLEDNNRKHSTLVEQDVKRESRSSVSSNGSNLSNAMLMQKGQSTRKDSKTGLFKPAPPPPRVQSIKTERSGSVNSSSSARSRRKRNDTRGSIRLVPGAWRDIDFLNERHLGRKYGPIICKYCNWTIKERIKPKKKSLIGNVNLPLTKYFTCSNCNKITCELFGRLVQKREVGRTERLEKMHNAEAGSSQLIEDEWIIDAGDGQKLYWIRVMTEEEELAVVDMYDKFKNLPIDELKTQIIEAGKLNGIPEIRIHQDIEHAYPSKDTMSINKEFQNTDEEEKVNDDDDDDNNDDEEEDIEKKQKLIELLIVATAWNSTSFAKEAYLRTFTASGELDWQVATEYSLDPMKELPQLLVTPDEIAQVSESSFDDRVKWFRTQFDRLKLKSNDRLNITVRRDCLLEDATNCFMTIENIKDLWAVTKYSFLNEDAYDAGGVAREFYTKVTQQLFDPFFGLFEKAGKSNGYVSYRINPNSGIANPLHLQYFRFFGRVMAKAMFDGYTINARLSYDVYKHLLSAPLGLPDVNHIDEDLAKSLQQIMEIEDISVLDLDFTTNLWKFGVHDVVELKEGGADIDVTNENREEYLELLFKYVMLDRHHLQLSFLLKGFDEVIPISLLKIFNASELEILLCGKQTIDLEDWKANVVYHGAFTGAKADHKIIKWFWEIMETLSQEQLAKVLFFATGSFRVQAGGFAALIADDGTALPFSISSLSIKENVYPQAHSCFFKIDLPLYRSKEQLEKYFMEGVEMAIKGGFTME